MLKAPHARPLVTQPHPILIASAKHGAITPGKNEGACADNQLVIGRSVRLECAKVLNCDSLIVEGEIEAEVSCRILKIQSEGRFKGKADTVSAEIGGTFCGELKVSDQVTITASGHVNGRLIYNKLTINEGGLLSGSIEQIQKDELTES